MNEKVIISIYNTEKKELVGVFRSFAVAARYVFSEASTWNSSRIWNAFSYKTRLHKNTIFDFPLALRSSSDKHIELLGNEDVYIAEGYPKMSKRRLDGMISCRTNFN